MLITIAEWSGSIFGLLGSFLLATNTRFSKYGWIGFLIANLGMGVFSVLIGAHGLLLQQLGFTCTSCLGLYRSRNELTWRAVRLDAAELRSWAHRLKERMRRRLSLRIGPLGDS